MTSIDNIQKAPAAMFLRKSRWSNGRWSTAVQMALPRNTSTKPNLESTKLAEFTPKEKCLLNQIHRNTWYRGSEHCHLLQIWWEIWKEIRQIQWNPVESSDQMRGGEWSNRRRIVNWRLWQKLWTKIFFSQAFSENSCAASSNYVPNLAAAMSIFFRIGLWT